MTTNATTAKPQRMRLYNDRKERLYINATEREAFIEAAKTFPDYIRIFCLTLLYTGCRLSEARELMGHSLQVGDNLLAFRTLKKRNQFHIREIPIPQVLVDDLVLLSSYPERGSIGNQYLWSNEEGEMIDRITAYRWVKAVMNKAGIKGPQACPKGLRHGYGIHAIRSGITLNMLCRWMGHSSIEITAIYANAVGPEEIELAERMW